MATESRRACGYRKVGGLYLVSTQFGAPCCKLPLALHVCPTCNSGVKQTRAWQWIDPRPWLAGECRSYGPVPCPAARPALLGERVGLLWIGAQFYPTPEDFSVEATRMGVSRRILAVPRGFKLGTTWVFLAHPRVMRSIDAETGEVVWKPGIFKIFRPTAIEKIVTATQAEDTEEMARLEKAGITPVVVPDDDRDHRGSVYDAEPAPVMI